MIADQDCFDKLILKIHAAAIEPQNWDDVLRSLCHWVSAEKAQLISLPAENEAAFWTASVGVSPESEREYVAQFASEDVWLRAGKRHNIVTPGQLSTGEQLIDRREFLSTRFYNDFLARHGYDRFMNVVLRPPMGPRMSPAAILSLHRGPGRLPFERLERDKLQRLAPHLIQATKTFLITRALSIQNAIVSKMLNAVTIPLFVIDHAGRLVFTNNAAEGELSAGKCLKLVNERLAPSRTLREQEKCKTALQRALEKKASTTRLTIVSTGQAVLLSTAPLSDSAGLGSPWRSAAALIWLAPVSVKRGSIDQIGAVFLFTPTEKKLLSQLASGSRLSESAKHLRISIHTARTHLKSIQHKSGWRTQGELIRMVQTLGIICVD